MPILYECDHGRRLITATFTEPHTVEEVLDVIDRQMADNAWEYATHLSTLDEARQITARVQALSGGVREARSAWRSAGPPNNCGRACGSRRPPNTS
jgi:hypothetical protein